MRSKPANDAHAPRVAAIVLGGLAAAIDVALALEVDPPIECDACAGWNEPIEPFRIHGDTYYVGTAELTALLVVTADGLVLLDGALPQSAALIDASIAKLGFRTEDIRLILNSHAHFDHAGGIAALQRASGAVVALSPSSAAAFRGAPVPDDPQFTSGSTRFPPAQNIRVVADGETLTARAAALPGAATPQPPVSDADSAAARDGAFTAHFTPGHTPGSTTWTWQSCEGDACLDIVYADSMNPVSADGFRFTGSATRPSVIAAFRASIDTVASLDCAILLAPHPGFIDLKGKIARLDEAANPFVDPAACRNYAAAARERLAQRIAAEARTAE